MNDQITALQDQITRARHRELRTEHERGGLRGLTTVRRRMIWNRRPEFGLEGSGSVG